MDNLMSIIAHRPSRKFNYSIFMSRRSTPTPSCLGRCVFLPLDGQIASLKPEYCRRQLISRVAARFGFFYSVLMDAII